MSLSLNDYNYNLPEDLIAIEPALRRDQSRLMVLRSSKKTIEDKKFVDIVGCLKRGDLLVLNDTKVFPARLIGNKQNGGKAEILLCKQVSDGIWQALGKNLKELDCIKFAGSKLVAEVVSKNGKEILACFNMRETQFWSEIDKIGTTPLPPYVKRTEGQKNQRTKQLDKERYQTVYAKKRGSAAAPTAGLHFSEEIIAKILEEGVKIEYLTLHVGLGTFLPVESLEISDHKMHSEYYHVSKELIEKIIQTKRCKGRVIAVGTTTCRAIETVFSDKGMARLLPNEASTLLASGHNQSEALTDKKHMSVSDIFGETDIFIHPPYHFKCVDCLITNFHLPKSTLIMLVSALAGREFILSAYSHAVKKRYRFFSYGDAMFIE